jgi:pyruvate kinase
MAELQEKISVELHALFDGNELPRAEVVNMQPGDVVFFSTDKHVTAEHHAQFMAAMQRVLQGQKILLLDGGITLQVYREQQGGKTDGNN